MMAITIVLLKEYEERKKYINKKLKTMKKTNSNVKSVLITYTAHLFNFVFRN